MRIDSHDSCSVVNLCSNSSCNMSSMDRKITWIRIVIIVIKIISMDTSSSNRYSSITFTIRSISHLIDKIRMIVSYSHIDNCHENICQWWVGIQNIHSIWPLYFGESPHLISIGIIIIIDRRKKMTNVVGFSIFYRRIRF